MVFGWRVKKGGKEYGAGKVKEDDVVVPVVMVVKLEETSGVAIVPVAGPKDDAIVMSECPRADYAGDGFCGALPSYWMGIYNRSGSRAGRVTWKCNGL